jgi:hypothetical protein
MTNKKEVAQVLIDAFDNEYYQKATVRSLAIAAVLRELVAELQYYQCCEEEGVEDMVLDARAILDVCDELENL